MLREGSHLVVGNEDADPAVARVVSVDEAEATEQADAG